MNEVALGFLCVGGLAWFSWVIDKMGKSSIWGEIKREIRWYKIVRANKKRGW